MWKVPYLQAFQMTCLTCHRHTVKPYKPYVHKLLLHLLYIGYTDNLLNADSEVWVTGMKEYSIKTPRFYPRRFENKCSQLLKDFYGITDHSHITTQNYEQIYSFILQNYWEFINKKWNETFTFKQKKPVIFFSAKTIHCS